QENVRSEIVVIQFDSVAQLHNSLIVMMGPKVDVAQGEIGGNRKRVAVNCAPRFCKRLRMAAHGGQEPGIFETGLDQVWINRKGTLKLPIRFLPIPAVVERACSQG